MLISKLSLLQCLYCSKAFFQECDAITCALVGHKSRPKASLTLLQDDASSSIDQAFAFGITLEKLSAHTVDEDGKPTFAKHNPMELLRKVRGENTNIMSGICRTGIQPQNTYLT